jgi:hypothetical protein
LSFTILKKKNLMIISFKKLNTVNVNIIRTGEYTPTVDS